MLYFRPTAETLISPRSTSLTTCTLKPRLYRISSLGNPVFLIQSVNLFQDGTLAEAGPIVADAKTGYGSGAADYDNDGWLDICIAVPSRSLSGETGDKNLLYHNNGDGTFERVLSGSLANDVAASAGCAWGDYNNDGFMDLAVSNGGFAGDQNNFLYRNNGNSNHWLKLNLIGTISPRSGVGANVRAKATIRGKTFWQRRAVHESDGEYSQHDPRPNFGLGDSTVAEVLRIEWPSGIVQEFRDVAANQSLTLTEPARLQVSGPGTFRVQSWKGMAVEVQASTNLAQWSPVTTMTNLTGTLEFTDPDAANRVPSARVRCRSDG